MFIASCQHIPGFQVIETGGDGDGIQQCELQHKLGLGRTVELTLHDQISLGTGLKRTRWWSPTKGRTRRRCEYQCCLYVVYISTINVDSLSDFTDIHAWMRHLNPILFPGVSTTIMVHSGFANEHEKTAQDILAQVNLTLTHTNAKNVYVVGHIHIVVSHIH